MITSTTVTTLELRGASDDSLTIEFEPGSDGDADVALQVRVQDKRVSGEFTVGELRELVRALVDAGFGREEDPVDRDRNPCGCGDQFCDACRS